MDISVTNLRRYPVKSMGGESLAVAELDARGVVGDRWYAVEDDAGRFASGKDTRRFRRRDAVFHYTARTSPLGRVEVSRGDECWYVGDPSLDERLSADMGTPVRVTPEAAVSHQDMGAVSIVTTATLQWCADRWGGSPDPRRLRVNVVVDSAEPFVEERWVGRELQLGSARLRVVERAPRCRMIDIVQDDAESVAKWLKPLARERDMFLAVYAEVTRPGGFTLGDRLRAF
jgi:MOSC domain-containing protein